MTNKNCLNCEKELTDKYCSGCGQKADTHRISFKNFIFHDVLHGTFHIDRGIFFTGKQALLRPGQAALDYISGKRKRYYNVFYLILIIFGLILFFRHFNDTLALSIGQELPAEKTYINEASRKLDELFAQKGKFILFILLPFAAFNSFILFRRKRLNLSEHIIIGGMILSGMLLISLFGNLFFYLDLIVEFNHAFAFVMSWLVTVLIIFHLGYGYYNAFSADYSRLGIAYRILSFFALTAFQMLILLYIAIGYFTNWKFGTVTVSPFG